MIVERLGAVHELLLAQAHEGAGEERVRGLQGARAREGPAAAAVALVLSLTDLETQGYGLSASRARRMGQVA